MSNKTNSCPSYETDYKKMVEEITKYLHQNSRDLEKKIEKELNPFQFLQLTAILVNTNTIIQRIRDMYSYCVKELKE